MRFIFYSTPAFSHLNCVYPVIEGLVDKGHTVLWYCTKRYKSLVESSGAQYMEYELDFEKEFDVSDMTSNLYELFKSLVNLNRRMYNLQLEITRRIEPDIILYDSMCGFAKNIAYSLNIRKICLCTTMAYSVKMLSLSHEMWLSSIKLGVTHLLSFIDLLKQEKIFRYIHGLPKFDMIDYFVNCGDVTIVFTPPFLQPYTEDFPETFKFVGTTIANRANNKQYNSHLHRDEVNVETDRNNCVYLAFGSVIHSKKSRVLLHKVLKSKYLHDKQAVVAGISGTKINDRVICKKEVNQLDVLRNVDTFINHGGLNSIYESIWYGVPQVCIPLQEEQRLSSKIVSRKGLALYIPSDRLYKLQDEQYIDNELSKIRKKMVRYKRLIRSCDGTKSAIKEIEDFGSKYFMDKY